MSDIHIEDLPGPIDPEEAQAITGGITSLTSSRQVNLAASSPTLGGTTAPRFEALTTSASMLESNLRTGGGAPASSDPKHPLNLCFAQGTPVSTPSGLRSIEQICEGERVLTWDPVAEQVVENVVTRLDVHEGHFEVVQVSIGDETITATPEHRFASAASWIPLHSASTVLVIAGPLCVHVPVRLEAGARCTTLYNLRTVTGSYLVGTARALVSGGTLADFTRPVTLTAASA